MSEQELSSNYSETLKNTEPKSWLPSSSRSSSKLKGLGKVSKKYTFALIGLVMQLVFLACIKELDFNSRNELAALISTQFGIVIIVVAYITGEAKIDVSAIARASYGKDDSREDKRN